MRFFKKLLLWGAVSAVLYFLLSYHFVFFGWDVKLLKKSKRTLNYTFFSTQGKTNKQILAVDELREDGIADLLIDEGRMTEEQKENLMRRYSE